MRQMTLTFPAPLSAKQLAACRELDRIVTAARNSFSVQDYAKRRRAMKHRKHSAGAAK